MIKSSQCFRIDYRETKYVLSPTYKEISLLKRWRWKQKIEQTSSCGKIKKDTMAPPGNTKLTSMLPQSDCKIKHQCKCQITLWLYPINKTITQKENHINPIVVLKQFKLTNKCLVNGWFHIKARRKTYNFFFWICDQKSQKFLIF